MPNSFFFLIPSFNFFFQLNSFLFINLILQHLIDFELTFVIYFDLFYKGLSWSYNPDHRFNRLTRIDPICYFLNILKNISQYQYLKRYYLIYIKSYIHDFFLLENMVIMCFKFIIYFFMRKYINND